MMSLKDNMSYCEEDGKDNIIFLSKEDYNQLPVLDKDLEKAIFEDDEDEPRGLILPNGDINWNCPCLGNMASGPCAPEFKQAFTCFHESTAEPKGSDCFERFKEMQTCFEKYPKVYDDQISDDIADTTTIETGLQNNEEIKPSPTNSLEAGKS